MNEQSLRSAVVFTASEMGIRIAKPEIDAVQGIIHVKAYEITEAVAERFARAVMDRIPFTNVVEVERVVVPS